MSWQEVQLYLNRAGQWQGFPAVVQPPGPTTQGIGYIGDDLTLQGSSTRPRDMLIASGWDPALLRIDAAASRTISDAAGVITGWRAEDFDPQVWIIALGSYELGSTDAAWDAAITTILNQINSGPGSAYTVYWMGLSLRDSSTDTRVSRFQAVLNSMVGDHAKITFKPLTWNAYVYNGRSQTGLWDSVDAAPGRLMTVDGYALRNQFITDSVNGITIDYGNPNPPDPESDWLFEPSAIHGGGFQNVIAVSPFTNLGTRPYLIGADVSGLHRSTDRGVRWTPVTSGSVGNSMHVAGIMWSATTAGKVFLAEDGGIHRSTDWGVTWARRTSVPDWDANNALTTAQGEHPRQTGYVMAQSGSTVWCGTLTQGLMRSTDDFATFAATALPGHPIRSIAVDPNDPTTIYVAVNRGTAAQNGIWRVDNATTTMSPATKLTGYPGTVNSPIGPEELLAVSISGVTHLIVAGHESGMFRYLPSTNAWQAINSGLAIGGTTPPVYRTICADPNDPSILYCGNWHPNARRAIWRSTNVGASWTQISAPTAGSIETSWTIFGTNTRWWGADISFQEFAGSNDWLSAMLAIDPDIPSRVLSVGRGGAWFGTLAQGVRTWQPANNGLMVTVNMVAANDGLNAGRFMIGNMDYTGFYSSDGLASVEVSKNPAAETTGKAVCFDMAATSGLPRAYVGASYRTQSSGTGAIWSTADPSQGIGAHWVDEVGGAFSSDVIALSVGRTAGGSSVILAGVANKAGETEGGLWRKVDTTWTQYRDPALVPFGLTGTGGSTNMGHLRFRRNSATVYAMDNDSVWRSNDAGATWVKILSGVASAYGTYNALELDPVDASKVYVSSAGTVRRIENANTSTGTANTTTTTLWTGNAGNIAIRPDGSQMLLNIRDGRLMRSTTFRTAASQAAASWVNIATPLFQRNSANIRSLTIDKNGTIVTADVGAGSWRGRRTTIDPTPVFTRTVDDVVYMKLGAPLRTDGRFPGYGKHEAVLGISNQGRDWSSGAVPKVIPPYPNTTFDPGVTYGFHNVWGECAPSSGGMPAAARDVRIEVDWPQVWHLSSGGVWTLKKTAGEIGNMNGGYWNGGTTYSKTIDWPSTLPNAYWRMESATTYSFDCKPMTNADGSPKDTTAIAHFFWGAFFPRLQLPINGHVAIVSRMRLIPGSPGVDVSQARFTGCMSGDAYETATTSVGSNGRNPSLTHPRHVKLGAQWRNVGMVSGTEAQIRSFPTMPFLV